MDPADADYVSNRAWAHAAQRNFDQALADYDVALRLDPKSSKRLAYRGRIWDEKGEHEKALTDYSEAIRSAHAAKLSRPLRTTAK